MPDDATAANPPLLPGCLLIAWALLLGGAIVLGLGLGAETPDYPSPFIISYVYRLVVGVELFVLLVAVPCLGDGRGGRPRAGLAGVVAIWAMGVPVAVVASWAADGDTASLAASQGYLLLAAAFVAAYLRADREERGRAAYWLLVAAFGAGAPILAFLVGDLMRTELAWLYAFSPFWVADRLCQAWAFGWEWIVPAGVLAVLAGLLRCVPRNA
jgi:hypothetical protein